MATADIAFVLFPRFSMIGLYSALEPLRVTNRFVPDSFSWRFVSVDGEPVSASNGIPVSVSARLAEIGRPDATFFCLSYDYGALEDRSVLAEVRKVARAGSLLGGIDTGALLLAEAGVLDGYRATCHWETLPAFRETYPSVIVTDALYEIDRGRLTASGGTVALDMMLDWLGERFGRALASKVADTLVHSRAGEPGEARIPLAARYKSKDPRLLAMIRAMEQNTEEPLALGAIAGIGGLSERQSQRLFERELGQGPKRLYLDIRLSRAGHLLANSGLGVREVALACGFSSLSHFSRAYKERFGLAPSRSRGGDRINV